MRFTFWRNGRERSCLLRRGLEDSPDGWRRSANMRDGRRGRGDVAPRLLAAWRIRNCSKEYNDG